MSQPVHTFHYKGNAIMKACDTTDLVRVTVEEVVSFLKTYLKEGSVYNATIYDQIAGAQTSGTVYGKYTLSVRNSCGIVGGINGSATSIIILEFKAQLKNMFVEFEIVQSK